MFKNVSKFFVLNYIHCTHVVLPFVTSRPSVLYYIHCRVRLISRDVNVTINQANMEFKNDQFIFI